MRRDPLRSPAPRVAILGAGGFLGSHLVPALLARTTWSIDAVDVTFAKLARTPGDRVRRIEARIDRRGLLDELTAGCDVIVSLTAICNPSVYNTDPLAVIDASYTDLVPVVKACAAHGRWLVHFSTCEVYGRRALDAEGRPTDRMREDETAMFLGPVERERWSYACAKQLLERLIFAHGAHHGLPFTIVRPFNVIGPRMDYLPGVDGEGVPRVLANFMSALLRNQPLPLVDGGEQRRSFVSVDDFIEGVVRILERPSACQGQILNLGNPANDASIRTLADLMRAAYARCLPGAPVPGVRDVTAAELYGEGYDDSAARLPDTEKARRLLGWDPTTTLEEMLPAIVADYVDRYAGRLWPGEAVAR
jgi:UDP-apiose/xylose synthase